MKNNSIWVSLFILTAMTSASKVHSQRDSAFTYEAVVEGNRKILLRDATKINSYPVIRDSVVKIPAIQYSTLPVSVENRFEPMAIAATRIQMEEKLLPLQRGYVRAGIGNFFTVPVELGYSSGRSKKGQMGAKYRLYRSSGLDLEDNSIPDDFTDQNATVWGDYFFKKLKVGGKMEWNNNNYHYYGLESKAYKEITPDLNNIDFEQRLNTVAIQSKISSFERDTGNVNFSAEAGYRNSSDLRGGKESQFNIHGAVRKLRNDALFKLSGGISQNTYERNMPVRLNDLSFLDTLNADLDSASAVRKTQSLLVNLSPSAVISRQGFRAFIGAAVFLDAESSRPVRFYPNAEISYNMFDGLMVPAIGVTGQTAMQTYYSLFLQNPFISPFSECKNLNERLHVYAQLSGALSQSVSYRTGVSYKRTENLPLFVNTYSSSVGLTRLWGNAFDVRYDDVDVLNVFGELSVYSRKSWNAFVRGDYYKYSTQKESSAWQLPTVKITSTLQYSFKEKFILNSEIQFWGSRDARSYTPLNDTSVLPNENGFFDIRLKPLLDLGFRLEYRYTKRLSFWSQMGNALGMKYRIWSGFPSQRFLAVIGAGYSF